MPVGLPNVPQGVILRASRSRWTGFSITLSLFLAALALAPSACREASAPLGAAALPPDTTLDLASLPTDVIPDRYIVVFKRSEEHTSELQSHSDLVCRLLLEKKNEQCELH